MRFLLNSNAHSLGSADIIDVQGRSDAELVALVSRGWAFGVLERQSPESRSR